jgi:hypothetical protein
MMKNFLSSCSKSLSSAELAKVNIEVIENNTILVDLQWAHYHMNHIEVSNQNKSTTVQNHSFHIKQKEREERKGKKELCIQDEFSR